MGPAILAVVVVRAWRRRNVLLAMGIGIVLGCLEWVLGGYLWYGGVGSRIQLAGQEPPSFSLYLSWGTQAKVLSGPWYCIPPTGCQGWELPGESVWWLAFLAVAALGFWAAWRTPARASSVLAAATAAWVIVLYCLLVPFGAPRYLTPSWALMSILAADGVVWLVTKARWHRAGIAIACVFLLSGLVSQRFVLQREAAEQTSGRNFATLAAPIRAIGIRPPCAMDSPSEAYYVGCIAPWTGETVPEMLARTSQGLKAWRPVWVPKAGQVVYVLAR
jgi:hypothetical protein